MSASGPPALRHGVAALVAFALATLVIGAPALLPAVAQPAAEINPCADGIADISGTIQACTLISGTHGTTVTLYTATLQVAAGIQDSGTGPTTHVSDTVGGQAFIFELNPARPWFVSIQTWNLAPGVRLESARRIEEVFVGEAVTFVFACDLPPCGDSAATRTPSPTWIPPQFRTPTVTLTPTGTRTTPTWTPSPTATRTETPTASATATLTATATALTTATATATPTATRTPQPTAAATVTPTRVPSATRASATSTGTPIPSATPIESERGARAWLPMLLQGW